MVDVHLIRHAHYVGHTRGYHAPDGAELSSLGHRSVITAAGRLPPVAGIVSSPLPRALQTAELFAEHSGIPLWEVIPELREWRSPTLVQGISPEAFPEDYAEWRSRRAYDPSSRYGDGESPQDLSERARGVRSRLMVLAEQYGPLLAVSHKLLLHALTFPHYPSSLFDSVAGENWSFLECRPLP